MSHKSKRSGSHSSSHSSQYHSSQSADSSRLKAYHQECLDQAYQSLSDLMEYEYSLQQYRPMGDEDRPLPNIWEGTDGFMKHLHEQFPMPKFGKVKTRQGEDKAAEVLAGKDQSLEASKSVVTASESKEMSTNIDYVSNEDEGDDLFVVMDMCGDVDAIDIDFSVTEEESINTQHSETVVEYEDLMMALNSAVSKNIKSATKSSSSTKASDRADHASKTNRFKSNRPTGERASKSSFDKGNSSRMHPSVKEASAREKDSCTTVKSKNNDEATHNIKEKRGSTLTPLSLAKSYTWTKTQNLEQIVYCAMNTSMDPKMLKEILQEKFRKYDKAIDNLTEKYHALRKAVQKKVKQTYGLSEVDLMNLGEPGRLFCGLFSEMEALRMTLNPKNCERALVFPQPCKLTLEEITDFERQYRKLTKKLRDLSIDHNALLTSESLVPVISEYNVTRGCETTIRTTALFYFNQCNRFQNYLKNKVLVYNVSQILAHCSVSDDSILLYENRKCLSVRGNVYLDGHLICSKTKDFKRKSTGPEDLKSLESNRDSVTLPLVLDVNPYGNPDQIPTQICHRNSQASRDQSHLRSNLRLSKVTSEEQTRESQERHIKPPYYPSIPQGHKDDPGFVTETYKYYDMMVEEWKSYNKHVKKRLHVFSQTDKTIKDKVGFCADMVKLSGLIQDLTDRFEENKMVQPKDNKTGKWAFSPDIVADIGVNAAKYLSSKFTSFWLNLRSVHSFFRAVFYKHCETIQSYNESIEADLKGQVILPDKTGPLGRKVKQGHYNSRGSWVRHRGGKRSTHSQRNFQGDFTEPPEEHEDNAVGYRTDHLFYDGNEQIMETHSYDEGRDQQTGLDDNRFSTEWDDNEVEMVRQDYKHPQHQKSGYEESHNVPRFPYHNATVGDNSSHQFYSQDIDEGTYDVQQDYDNAHYEQENDYSMIKQHENETFYDGENTDDYSYRYDEVKSGYNFDERHGNEHLYGEWNEGANCNYDTTFQRPQKSLHVHQGPESSTVQGSTSFLSRSLDPRNFEGPPQTFPSFEDTASHTSSATTSQIENSDFRFSDRPYSRNVDQPIEVKVNTGTWRESQTSQSYQGVDPANRVNMDCSCGCGGTVLDGFPTRPPPGLQEIGSEAQYWVRMSLISYDISRLSSLLGNIVGLFNKINRNSHRDAARAMVNMCATLPLLAAGIRHGQRDQQAKGFSQIMPYTETEVTELGFDCLPSLASNSAQVEKELCSLYKKFNAVFRERKTIIVRFNAHAENFCTIRNRAFSYKPADHASDQPMASKSKQGNKASSLGDFGVFSNKESSQDKIAYYQTMLSVQKQVAQVRKDIRVLDKGLKQDGIWNTATQQHTLQKVTAFDAKLIDCQKSMSMLQRQRKKFGNFVPRYIQSLMKVGSGTPKKTIDNHIKNYDFILKMIAWGMRELKQLIEAQGNGFHHLVMHLESMKVETTGSSSEGL